MKAAVALNGMFLCRDAELLCLMNRVLDDLSIDVVLCMDAPHAMKAISERVLDCAIVEWSPQAERVMHQLQHSELNHECFTVALVNSSEEMNVAFNAGAAIVMQKPGSSEHALRCMRAAYGSLMRQRRTAFRAVVRIPVEVRRDALSFSAVIVNLSHSGLCLYADADLAVRDCLETDFSLPSSTTPIRTTGRVVWVKHNHAGIKFSSMSQQDFVILKNHLDEFQRHLGAAPVVAPSRPEPGISDLLSGLATLTADEQCHESTGSPETELKPFGRASLKDAHN